MSRRLQGGCPAIPGREICSTSSSTRSGSEGHDVPLLDALGQGGKEQFQQPGMSRGTLLQGKHWLLRGTVVKPLPRAASQSELRVPASHEAATSPGGQALAPHHMWPPGSPVQAAAPTTPPGWHEGQRGEGCLAGPPRHRRLQGSCSSLDIVPPLKLCHPQASPLTYTGCHTGGGSREQLLSLASFVVKPSLPSSTALLRMPVWCGIAQLHQGGFLVPGEPHCQPEAPGAAGGVLSTLDAAGMEVAAILLLLWPY